jgi:hypothetical protein
MASLSALSARGKSPFDVVADSSLHDPGLPFASVLDAAMIGRVFRQDEALVGQNDMIPNSRVQLGKRPRVPVNRQWDHPGHPPILLHYKYLHHAAPRWHFIPLRRRNASRIGVRPSVKRWSRHHGRQSRHPQYCRLPPHPSRPAGRSVPHRQPYLWPVRIPVLGMTLSPLAGATSPKHPFPPLLTPPRPCLSLPRPCSRRTPLSNTQS